jgi:hypothetical protein
LAKEEKRKSREAKIGVAEHTDGENATDHDNHGDLQHEAPMPLHPDEHPADSSASNPTSPTSPNSKGFKSLLSKLKRRSRPSNAAGATGSDGDKAGFIGGAALRNSGSHSHSQPSSPAVPTHIPTTKPPAERRLSGVSSISSMSSRGRSPNGARAADRDSVSAVSEYEEARDQFNEDLAPPPSFTVEEARRASPTRDSRFKEMGI